MFKRMFMTAAIAAMLALSVVAPAYAMPPDGWGNDCRWLGYGYDNGDRVSFGGAIYQCVGGQWEFISW